MISKKQVVWAYTRFLGRRPENRSVVNDWATGTGSLQQLVNGLIYSDEFKRRSWEQEVARDLAYARMKRIAIVLALFTACAIGYFISVFLPRGPCPL
jgi:hypothetical protein